MLTRAHIQEGLSRAYTMAIAHKAGCNISTPVFDYGIDGVFNDLTVRDNRHIMSGYSIDYQLKATTTAIITNTEIKYDLEVKNYNDLVTVDVGTPRILVLYLMPEDDTEWIKIMNDETILKNCGWWCSLRGQAPTKNGSTVRISIPIDQVLTPDSLRKLVDKVKVGDIL